MCEVFSTDTIISRRVRYKSDEFEVKLAEYLRSRSREYIIASHIELCGIGIQLHEIVAIGPDC
ncbi:hypothetical protein CA54_54760 [Symmachiella macrocystis]|uniref:Uncharacterized protein n=1 Tax=Symmachiella macrocystis TaxID=2527985 RepID=A0A5C6B6C8_9PLAN|nr:hypothetical protein CA54_54760 [Symmachiella macrocystis]